MTTDANGGFYEDDENLDELLAAFEAGPQGVTARPAAVETVQHPNEETVAVTVAWGSASQGVEQRVASWSTAYVVSRRTTAAHSQQTVISSPV